MEKEKIARINELARLAKERPLSEAEKAEQAALRQAYLRDFRASFGATLAHTVIQYPDGSREKLHKKETAPPAPETTPETEEMCFHTANAAETEEAGAALARRMQRDHLPPFVALYGDLGAGKTAFVRGFARVLAPEARVKSPTFALVHEYRGADTVLFHFDMYRITGEDDLASIGFEDYLTRDGICLAEWCENIPFALPREFVRVDIRKDDPAAPDHREIRVKKETLC